MGSCLSGGKGGRKDKPRADKYKQDDELEPKNAPANKASAPLEKKKFSWDEKRKNFNAADY